MSGRNHCGPVSKALPPCDGPKLGMFPHFNDPIRWLERLDKNTDNGSSTEGYVFRARIKRRDYAIKIFKFYDPMSTEYFWGPLMGEDTPLQTAAYYTDPFYAECRAYGKIQEAIKRRRLKNDITVECHGYLFLGPRNQKLLEKRQIKLGLDKVDLSYQRKMPGGCRVRAIVKDLASSDHGIGKTNLRKLSAGMIALNRQGVFNMDLRIENYRDGKIVDFGASWIEPHPLFRALGDEDADEFKLADRVMFDEMIRNEGIPNPKGIVTLHPMRLRRRRA